MLTVILFQIIVLIFSVIIHEISHGFMALRLGDTTAKDAGRLTLNPAKHLDFFGSFLLPLLLAVLKAPVVGWAKPVPYNPNRLKNPKQGSGLIAAAGPVSNLLVAIIFGLGARILAVASPDSALLTLVNFIIFINLALAVFNLIPIPPLDGSGILFSILPRSFAPVQEFLMRFGFIILIIFILYGLSLISPVVFFLYNLITGSATLWLKVSP